MLDKNGQLIKSLTTAEAQALIDDGTISGGMIPKIESCIDVIAEGVEGVVIINGRCRMRCCSNCSPSMAPAP